MASNRSGRAEGPPPINGMFSVKVDNLHFNASIVELREMFERYGEIGDVYIPRDRRNQQGRGFGFVRFLRRRDAEHAADRMDGRRVGGRELRCGIAKYSRPFDDREARRRGGGGGSYGGRRDRSRSRSRTPPPRRERSRSSSPVRRKRSVDNEKAGDSPKRSRHRSGSEKEKKGDSRSPSPRSDRSGARGRRSSGSPRRNGSERSGSS